jgi:hypothetical protein
MKRTERLSLTSCVRMRRRKTTARRPPWMA